MTPWDEWWGMTLKDDSNPQIALLPLHPDVRARFNESAAWDFARSMYGKPYGYHNMIFSWIDTMSDNYPPPLDANLVLLCLGINLVISVSLSSMHLGFRSLGLPVAVSVTLIHAGFSHSYVLIDMHTYRSCMFNILITLA